METSAQEIAAPQARERLPDGVWKPETVLSTLPHQPEQNSTSPVPFFHLLERLKTTKREGWTRFGIQHGESISDHMYRMSIITLLCPPQLACRLDLARCMKMATIHDMAESLVGDITPVDHVPKAEKSRREEETMDLLCKGLLGNVHGGASGQHIKDIWREYEDDETEEAHFVHDVDKIELLLQTVEYERTYQGKKDLKEFYHVQKRVMLPEMQKWADEIMEERRAFWDSVGKPIDDHAGISKATKDAQEEYYAGNKS